MSTEFTKNQAVKVRQYLKFERGICVEMGTVGKVKKCFDKPANITIVEFVGLGEFAVSTGCLAPAALAQTSKKT
jgi:hypothetical protein